MSKGIIYHSFRFSRYLIWLTGLISFIVIVLIGFTGYSLIWDHSLIKCYTLRRFYVLHFILPFILLGLSIIHLIILHRNISKCFIDIGIINGDSYLFGLFIIKDFSLFILVLFILSIYCLSTWYIFSIHPDNFILALIFVTPSLIEPEWYFLPFYSMLRSIPFKLIGVLILIDSLLLLILIIFNDELIFMNHLFILIKVFIFILISLFVYCIYIISIFIYS